MKHTAILIAALLAAAGAQAACYTVMGPKDKILSQSPNPPVNMAYQLHETVPNKYGDGATMVFGLADDDCGKPVDIWGNDGTVKATANAPVRAEVVEKGKKGKKAKHAAPVRHHKAQAEEQPASAPAAGVPSVQAQPRVRSQRETGQVRLRPASAAAPAIVPAKAK